MNRREVKKCGYYSTFVYNKVNIKKIRGGFNFLEYWLTEVPKSQDPRSKIQNPRSKIQAGKVKIQSTGLYM
jgi:hypothetical protein